MSLLRVREYGPNNFDHATWKDVVLRSLEKISWLFCWLARLEGKEAEGTAEFRDCEPKKPFEKPGWKFAAIVLVTSMAVLFMQNQTRDSQPSFRRRSPERDTILDRRRQREETKVNWLGVFP